MPLQRHGDRAGGAARRQFGACAPQKIDLRGQGQCAGNITPVAFNRESHHAHRISRCGGRTHVGGLAGPAFFSAPPPPRPVLHPEHVWRYSHPSGRPTRPPPRASPPPPPPPPPP